MTKVPWEDERGATDVDGFLAAYAEDDNTFWRMESGHAMNVIDELIGRLEEQNPLAQMMATQLELQTKSYGFEPSTLEGADRANYVRTMALAAVAELIETIDETSWKTWAKDQGAVHSREAFISELVDVWHFVMNLLLVVGCTPDEFFDGYMAKAEKNRRRQAEGYSSRTNKCPGCYRALDDADARCTAERCGYEDKVNDY